MLIRAKAPLRISFGGGGTDISPFCNQYGGAVLNATISLFAHCTLEARTDDVIFFNSPDINNSETLACTYPLPLEGPFRLQRGIYNRIIRDYNGGIPISINFTTFCDVPPGSGLGSSSTLTVAIISAFAELLNLPLGEYDIAKLAFEIERLDVGYQGGKQDSYAAAFGGVNFIEFLKQDQVIVNPLRIKPWILSELESSIILLYTGVSRVSSDIIANQIQNINESKNIVLEATLQVKEHAFKMKDFLLKGCLEDFFILMRAAWESKKSLASGISNTHIDVLFNAAMAAGVKAGKISGAGGGGFMMLFINPTDRISIMNKLSPHKVIILPCHFYNQGVGSWRVPKK